MNHIAEDLLIAVVLDEAEPDTRAEVDIHLATCDRCRKDAEELRRVLQSAAIDDVPERAIGLRRTCVGPPRAASPCPCRAQIELG